MALRCRLRDQHPGRSDRAGAEQIEALEVHPVRADLIGRFRFQPGNGQHGTGRNPRDDPEGYRATGLSPAQPQVPDRSTHGQVQRVVTHRGHLKMARPQCAGLPVRGDEEAELPVLAVAGSGPGDRADRIVLRGAAVNVAGAVGHQRQRAAGQAHRIVVVGPRRVARAEGEGRVVHAVAKEAAQLDPRSGSIRREYPVVGVGVEDLRERSRRRDEHGDTDRQEQPCPQRTGQACPNPRAYPATSVYERQAPGRPAGALVWKSHGGRGRLGRLGFLLGAGHCLRPLPRADAALLHHRQPRLPAAPPSKPSPRRPCRIIRRLRWPNSGAASTTQGRVQLTMAVNAVATSVTGPRRLTSCGHNSGESFRQLFPCGIVPDSFPSALRAKRSEASSPGGRFIK